MNPDRGQLVRIAADDRSGAIETAGAIASSIDTSVTVHPWTVQPWTEPVDEGPATVAASLSVVDLETRHLDPGEAGRRATLVDRAGPDGGAANEVLRCHKIDSTLRGNWAHELAARAVPADHVLVVPALPALGRTCVGGTVRVHGVPVQPTPSTLDGDRVLFGARPAEMIRAAVHHGRRIEELTGVGDLHRWLRGPPGFAVCDAVTEEDLTDLAAAVAAEVATGGRRWPLVAGTSAVIAAMVRARLGPTPRAAVSGGRAVPSSRAGVVVVCGSRHPVARRQIAALGSRDGVILLLPPTDPGDPRAVALDLAARARRSLRRLPDAVVVVIGGDTAAAFLGDRAVHVCGVLEPGTAWGHDGDGSTIVVRSGGFGDDGALLRLVTDRLSP